MSAKKSAEITTLVQTANAPAPVQQEGATILAMIDKISGLPNIDPQQVLQLYEIHQRMEADKARKEWATAFAAVMKEVTPIIKKEKNKQTNSQYATHDALDAVLRPIYTKHGMSPTFTSESSDKPDHIKIVGFLIHEGGHERRYEIDMPADGKGPKGNDVMTKTHATGSATTYGKRYLLIDMFNLPLVKDDDGNRASQQAPANAPISEEQVAELEALAKTVGANVERFCKLYEIESFADITVGKFNDAKAALNKKRG